MRFPDQDEVVEGFAAFADKAFRKGVAWRRGRWSKHDYDYDYDYEARTSSELPCAR